MTEEQNNQDYAVTNASTSVGYLRPYKNKDVKHRMEQGEGYLARGCTEDELSYYRQLSAIGFHVMKKEKFHGDYVYIEDEPEEERVKEPSDKADMGTEANRAEPPMTEESSMEEEAPEPESNLESMVSNLNQPKEEPELEVKPETVEESIEEPEDSSIDNVEISSDEETEEVEIEEESSIEASQEAEEPRCQAETSSGGQCKNDAKYPEDDPIYCGVHKDKLEE